MTDLNKKLTFTFTVEEANGILAVLGELPYTKSAAIIQAIQMQAIPQLAEQQAVEEKAENQE